MEGAIERNERGCRQDSEAKTAFRQRTRGDEAARGARPVRPPEVERVRRLAVTQQENDPGNPASDEVGLDHAPEGPALQVRALDRRIELDRISPGAEAHAEVDVLEPLQVFVEPAHRVERIEAKGFHLCLDEVLSDAWPQRSELAIRGERNAPDLLVVIADKPYVADEPSEVLPSPETCARE